MAYLHIASLTTYLLFCECFYTSGLFCGASVGVKRSQLHTGSCAMKLKKTHHEQTTNPALRAARRYISLGWTTVPNPLQRGHPAALYKGNNSEIKHFKVSNELKGPCIDTHEKQQTLFDIRLSGVASPQSEQPDLSLFTLLWIFFQQRTQTAFGATRPDC